MDRTTSTDRMLFLINLDDAHARRASMYAQLDALGLAHERIGVDFRRSSTAQIDMWIAARFPGFSFDHGSVSTAEIGCWASHLCTWQALAASEAQACTVLEDDLTLDPAFNEALCTLVAEPVLDLVFLGTSSRNVSTRKSLPAGRFRLHRALGTIYNTWGYVVARTWVRRFLARDWRIDRPIDHYTGGRRAGVVKPRVAVLRPAVVREHEALGPLSQIEPFTYRIDRARIVEQARRRIIASRVSALYYKLYDYL
jgi:glycosyl transferase family 25